MASVHPSSAWTERCTNELRLLRCGRQEECFDSRSLVQRGVDEFPSRLDGISETVSPAASTTAIASAQRMPRNHWGESRIRIPPRDWRTRSGTEPPTSWPRWS